MKIAEILELVDKNQGIKPDDYRKRASALAVGHLQDITVAEGLLKETLTPDQRQRIERLVASLHDSDGMFNILEKISVGGPELTEGEVELINLVNTSPKKND